MRQLLLTFLLLSSLLSQGQTLLKGTITDQQGNPLFGASIYYRDTYTGTSSNEEGSYTIESAVSGKVWVMCEFIGFQTDSVQVSLGEGENSLNFALKESLDFLEGVTIVASSFEAGDEKRATTLTPLEISSTAGALGDIVGAINTLPGATRVGESGRLFVRGGDSRESATYIDGTFVQVPYHSANPNLATRGRFNPFLFKGTVFNTGGYSAEYGQALSSVLLLNTNDAKTDDELNLSLLSVGADITATKSWEKGSLTASAFYIDLAPYLSLANTNVDFGQAPQFLSNETSLRQRVGKDGFFKLYTNLSKNTSRLSQNDLDNEGQQLETALSNTNSYINASFSKGWSGKLNTFHGLSLVRNQEEIGNRLFDFNSRVNAYHLKNKIQYDWGGPADLNAGVDYFFHDEERALNDNPASLKRNTVAAFAEANITTQAKLVFRPGLRYEYAAALAQGSLMPRLSAAYVIDQYSQWSFAYGRYFQEPATDFLLVTQDLQQERADHWILSYQKDKNQQLFRSEAFYKGYQNLIRVNDGLSPIPNTEGFYDNSGDGFAYGLDLFFRDRKTITNGSFWVSYGFLVTERNYLDFPEPVVPTFASRHNFSVVYKHWLASLKSQVGLDFSYSSARYFDDPNEEGLNDGRIKPFQQLNLSWAYLHRSNFIGYAAVTNLLGTDKEFGQRFSTVADENGSFRQETIRPFAKRFLVIGVFYTLSKDKGRNQLDKIN